MVLSGKTLFGYAHSLRIESASMPDGKQTEVRRVFGSGFDKKTIWKGTLGEMANTPDELLQLLHDEGFLRRMNRLSDWGFCL